MEFLGKGSLTVFSSFGPVTLHLTGLHGLSSFWVYRKGETVFEPVTFSLTEFSVFRGPVWG